MMSEEAILEVLFAFTYGTWLGLEAGLPLTMGSNSEKEKESDVDVWILSRE